MSHYTCTACGWESPRLWRVCQNCSVIGAMVFAVAPGPAEQQAGGRGVKDGRLHRLMDLPQTARGTPTGLPLIDEAWGGGLHKGRTCFLAGAPGAGKTTLALKLADLVGASRPVLFVSGEESEAQVRGTADRIGVAAPNIWFVYGAELPEMLTIGDTLAPDLLIVNSINTCRDPAVRGLASSSGQIKHCGLALIGWTARRPVMTLIIGHLVWRGHSAGPRTVEHEVDIVCYATVNSLGERQLQVRKSRISHSPAVYPIPDFTQGLSIA